MVSKRYPAYYIVTIERASLPLARIILIICFHHLPGYFSNLSIGSRVYATCAIRVSYCRRTLTAVTKHRIYDTHSYSAWEKKKAIIYRLSAAELPGSRCDQKTGRYDDVSAAGRRCQSSAYIFAESRKWVYIERIGFLDPSHAEYLYMCM